MQTQQIIKLAELAGWKDLRNYDSEMHEFIVMGSFKDLESFAKLVAKAKAEELATELEKGPLNDTATSIAIWIRSQE